MCFTCEKCEKEKNDGYLERCLQSENSEFIPLVYSTTGGTGPSCEAYHKRLALLMAAKRKDSYSAIIDHIRTKVRFTVLKSIVMGIRGFRYILYVKSLKIMLVRRLSSRTENNIP